jgi:hypothetical protein
MIVIGTGSETRPGCYLGAAATTHPQSGRIKNGVEQDELGLSAARFLGKRVVDTLRLIHETPFPERFLTNPYFKRVRAS